MASAEKNNPETVFKPQYPGRVRVTIILYPIGVIFCIFFTILAITSSSVFPNAIYALIFGLTVLTMPMILFREARFGRQITVKRYFLPRRTIKYEDIVEMNQRGLVAKRGGIPLVNVQNRAEFEKIIKRLVVQGKVKLKK